jgi:hypothetical protein
MLNKSLELIFKKTTCCGHETRRATPSRFLIKKETVLARFSVLIYVTGDKYVTSARNGS